MWNSFGSKAQQPCLQCELDEFRGGAILACSVNPTFSRPLGRVTLNLLNAKVVSSGRNNDLRIAVLSSLARRPQIWPRCLSQRNLVCLHVVWNERSSLAFTSFKNLILHPSLHLPIHLSFHLGSASYLLFSLRKQGGSLAARGASLTPFSYKAVNFWCIPVPSVTFETLRHNVRHEATGCLPIHKGTVVVESANTTDISHSEWL